MEVRGRGLMLGIQLNQPARPFGEPLAERGVLCKETHDLVIRIALPLIVEEEELTIVVEQVGAVLE